MNKHFELVTKSGVCYRFGRRCNRVNYDNEQICIFEHVIDDEHFETLAVMPYSNIEIILNVDKDEELE